MYLFVLYMLLYVYLFIQHVQSYSTPRQTQARQTKPLQRLEGQRLQLPKNC